jgi:UPF0271 protein
VRQLRSGGCAIIAGVTAAHPPAAGAVDLNCDLAEGFGRWDLTDDERLLELVSSANVACGFHAGDPVTLRRVCARAAELHVAVGAQVAFRDLVGFGRRRMDCTADELAADVLYQLGAVHAFCTVVGTVVAYVKPHGALYHELAADQERAEAVVAAIAAFDSTLAVLGLPGSALLAAAQAQGLRAVREGFPDRAYRADGGLVPRGAAGALITDARAVARRAVSMVTRHEVESIDGVAVRLIVESLCIHGDSPDSVATASAVRSALTDAGCRISPFA